MSIYIGNNFEDRLKALETENSLLRKYNDYHQVVHEIDKGGQVHCMEVVLCLSQKVAKNGQILSMFVPKKWLFSLLLQPHQAWLFKSKNWLMSKICQPLTLVSGLLGLISLAFCTVISWTQLERSSQPLSLI